MAIEVIESDERKEYKERKLPTQSKCHYGMFFRPDKIGDGLVYSSCPENFYKSGKGKVMDTENVWFFDHNPFIERSPAQCSQKINMQQFADHTTFFPYGRSGLPCFLSIQDRFNTKFGVNTVVRHPRLYKYEDAEIIPNKLVVHTTGDRNEPIALYEDCGAVMHEEVMDVIQKNYQNYDIIQVGGEDDNPFNRGCKDHRGQTMWEMAEEISNASIFIGVNSGPMNVALCYPRVNIRCYEPQFPQTYLENMFVPMDAKFPHNQWFDYGIKIFNRYDIDLGATYSYKKI